MKYLNRNKLCIFFLIVIFSSNALPQDEKHETGEVKGTKVSGGMLYGSELTPDMKIIKLGDLLDDSTEFEGKTVAIEGKVTDVCQSMGCWMILSDGTNEIRVQTLHKFFLPKDCATNSAVVEGVLKIKEISEEQARHLNDEAKNSKVKSEDIVEPQMMYTIETKGVKIMDK